MPLQKVFGSRAFLTERACPLRGGQMFTSRATSNGVARIRLNFSRNSTPAYALLSACAGVSQPHRASRPSAWRGERPYETPPNLAGAASISIPTDQWQNPGTPMRVLLATILACALAACGASSTPPTQTPPATPPDSGTTISGREHIGWTQAADSVAGYVFLLYVDDVRNQLPQAMCTLNSGGSFDCNSPLPPLTNGKHTLQLAAAIPNGDSLVEGPKSAAIVVTVDSASDSASTIRVTSGDAASSTGTGSAGPSTPSASCGLAPWDPATALAWSSNGALEL